MACDLYIYGKGGLHLVLLVKGESLEEAVETANGRMNRTQPYSAKIGKTARLLEVGAIKRLPKHGIGYYPFGGRKDSGIGRRDQIRHRVRHCV